MRPRDWFLVGLRLLGAWIFYLAVRSSLAAATYVMDLMPEYSIDHFDNAHSGAMYNLWYALGYGTLGLYFIFGAEGLTKWIFDEYPRDEDTDADDTAAEDSDEEDSDVAE